MFRSLKRRIDNANQMHKMRNENPELFNGALEENVREQQSRESIPAAKPGPVIRFFRWVLVVLTALIVLIIAIGVPRSSNPVFTLLSLALLLTFLYMAAGLAHPAVVFFRKKWSRECVLELFGVLSIGIILLMVVFRP